MKVICKDRKTTKVNWIMWGCDYEQFKYYKSKFDNKFDVVLYEKRKPRRK